MSKDKEERYINDSLVARHLTEAINKSAKTQAQIAVEAEFTNSNMITMIKQGRTHMPPQKVKLLADSLNIDSRHLMKMVFEEYQPGVWDVIEQVFRSSDNKG